MTRSSRGAITSASSKPWTRSRTKIQDQLRSIALRSWMAKPTYLREAEQHREVAKAVESRDARRAADLLRTHIAQFEEQFVRALEYEPTGSKTGLKRR
jgi:DNA-binding GntR family transcriptional regulator